MKLGLDEKGNQNRSFAGLALGRFNDRWVSCLEASGARTQQAGPASTGRSSIRQDQTRSDLKLDKQILLVLSSKLYDPCFALGLSYHFV